MTSYSNPRMHAEIADWPLGVGKRGTAVFTIEVKAGKGERAVRTTTGKPKALSFARKARIVDGDDGRTYIAELTVYGHVSIMRGDMKYSHELIHEGDPRLPEILKLFAEGC